jgi:anionic cell wall polymer biosynthesis LytR-Cps2A-Psr (LCP) family protein
LAKSKKNSRKNRENLYEDEYSEYSPRRNKRNQKKSKSVLGVIGKSIVIVLLLAILSGMVYFVKGLMDTNNFLNNSYQPRKSSSVENDKIDVQKDPISVLILGLDDNSERELGSARTDSMLLLTINPKDELVNIVSIPRDTYTDIVSDSFTGKDKINAAFSYGGIDSTIDSVEKLLNVPIIMQQQISKPLKILLML